MAVYYVTAPLGGGKTLMCIHRIFEALSQGRVVATNIDVFLYKSLIPPKYHDNIRLIRIPDQPTCADLVALGLGNDKYDEKRNGLIVLDECGTWFNARTWADKDRQKVINWLLHSRKKRWDVYFIVQDISIIDKQARKSTGEHVAYCRRSDRVPIPVFGPLYKLLTGRKLPLPRVHVAAVKYGLLPTSLTVDNWVCRGNKFFKAYDTEQEFFDDYPHGPHCILPPWFNSRVRSAPKTKEFYMRLTKIYLRRFSRPLTFFLGCFFVMLIFVVFLIFGQKNDDQAIASVGVSSRSAATPAVVAEQPVKKMTKSSEKTDHSDQVVDYSLDYILVGGRYLISFNGARYSQYDFPFPLRQVGSTLYASIPQLIAADLQARKMSRLASVGGGTLSVESAGPDRQGTIPDDSQSPSL